MTPLSDSCPGCGAPIRDGARFCHRCGAAFAPEPAAPRAGDGGGLVAALGTYFACLAIALWHHHLAAAGDRDPSTRPFYLALAGVAFVAFAIWWRANLPLLRPPRITTRSLLTLAVGTAALVAVIAAVRLALPDVWGSSAEPYQVAGKSLAYTLVDTAVLPGVIEELLFRGVILSGLLSLFERRTAIAVSALLFATLHVSPVAFFHLAVLGFVLAIVRIDTKSIYLCILVHSAYNAANVLIEW